FFFSSRRRHTRSTRDWSSDVCSSDLHRLRLLFDELSRGIDPALGKRNSERDQVEQHRIAQLVYDGLLRLGENRELNKPFLHRCRSEERRVGKECRSGWGASSG